MYFAEIKMGRRQGKGVGVSVSGEARLLFVNAIMTRRSRRS